MNWNRIEGNWKQLKGKVLEQWGKLTDDDLDVVGGKREQLAGKIQKRYGIARSFVKIIARLAIPIYCRDIAINQKEYLKHKGPLLLATNHPNSFLDAIILCTLFDKPIYSLSRGDAFKNRFSARLLFLFKMFPVYRVSEGVENLEENYKTFEQCKSIFKQNGIVLIFSEGRCINEWHLRPLKKGTARLAISSWAEGIDLEVLPVAINYSSFKKFGKKMKLFFGNMITKEQVDYKNSDACHPPVQ